MSNQRVLGAISQKCARSIYEAESCESNFDQPFKHLILDNFLPNDFAKKLLNSFPAEHSKSWLRTNDAGLEVKARSNWESEFDIPETIVDAVRIFNSAMILKAISKVLDIPKLMPDPYFTGGGLNMSEKNGLLDVHIDGNYHDASGLNRRVNLLYYMNPNWVPSWGGEFGVYDNKGERLIKSIEPIHNRCLIFDTHDKSYHGLPNPINFPKGDPRRSLILYYYTAAPRTTGTVEVPQPHSALWKSTGFTDKKGKKTRDYE